MKVTFYSGEEIPAFGYDANAGTNCGTAVSRSV